MMALFDQFIEIVEPLLAPLHQTRMLNRRKDLAAVMRHALVRDINADGIELAAWLTDRIKHITHHRIHVRAEPAFALNIRRRIVLEKDAPLMIHDRGVIGREADRFIGVQRSQRREQQGSEESEDVFLG